MNISAILNHRLWAVSGDHILPLLIHASRQEAFRDTALSLPGSGAFFAGRDTHIPITAPIIKGYGMLGHYGTDPDILASLVDKAASDPSVGRIVLDVDCPGGTLAGTERLAQAVRDAKAVKPVIARVDGLCCSAAYWVASQATEIHATETSMIGSIGVRLSIMDFSEWDKRIGIRVFEFASGKWKCLGSDAHTPSEEEQAKLQQEVEAAADIFFRWVEEGRGISSKTIKGFEADTFYGPEALKHKLIDTVCPANFPSGNGSVTGLFSKGKTMKDKILEALKASHPGQEALVDAVFSQAESGLSVALEKAKTDLAAATEKLAAAEAAKNSAISTMETMQKVMADQVVSTAFAATAIPEKMAEDLAKTLSADAFMENGVLKLVEWEAHVAAKVAEWNKPFADEDGGEGGEIAGMGSTSSAARPSGHGKGQPREDGYTAEEIKARRGM